MTQELYEKVMGVNPSRKKSPPAPVCGVQWTDAVRFCNRCSEAEGLDPCYDLETWACDFAADGYRLPTEAEWEYACRAGSTKRYVFGDGPSALGAHAWTKRNSGGTLHPAGQKGANAWGLRDMLGHVWEWCNDWYAADYYLGSPKEDPRGPAQGEQRVLRGAAWDVEAAECRPAVRKKEFPVYTDACFGVDANGFRRVKDARLPKSCAPVFRTGAEAPARAEPSQEAPASSPSAGRETIPGARGRSPSSAIGPARSRSGGCGLTVPTCAS